MTIDVVTFSLLTVGLVGTAIIVITRRNPVISVLFLIGNFFFLAVLYLTLEAQFIAIIQILVYAGAIMVLFLFVIMLLNLGDERGLVEKLTAGKWVAIGFSAAILLQIALPLVLSGGQIARQPHAGSTELGSVEYVGKTLFTRYVFPFEIVSLLLLAAIVGAIVLAKKKLR